MTFPKKHYLIQSFVKVSYLQMKHILFARENTACKHEKTTKKIQKILPENPGKILRGKALKNRKSQLTGDTIGDRN